MERRPRRLVIVCLALAPMVGGCGSSETRDPFRPAQAPAGCGVVYVFRGAESPGGAVRVVIHQETAGFLDAGEYLYWVLPPGEAVVRVEERTSAVRLVNVEADGSVFLEVRTATWGDRIAMDEPPIDVGREAVTLLPLGRRRFADADYFIREGDG